LPRDLLKQVFCRWKKDFKASDWFSKSQLNYLRAYDRSSSDMNLFQIVQTIQKLKATVQVLVDDDYETLLQIKKNYFRHQNIH
jgi:hypothetical protein